MALARGRPLTDGLLDEARGMLNWIVHFLDLPLFTLIVYCGTRRPGTWSEVGLAMALALLVATALTIGVPRLTRPQLTATAAAPDATASSGCCV